MQTLIHADIFFFIASIGFVLMFGLSVVVLIYLIGILRSVRHMSRKIEGDIESVSTEVKEFVVDMRESRLYRMVFGKKRSK